MEECQEQRKQLVIDPEMFSKVITGEKKWCYGYDPETKWQNGKWKAPRIPKRIVRSNAA